MFGPRLVRLERLFLPSTADEKMGYSVGRSLGEMETWLGAVTASDEVYIYQALVKNAELQSPHDALLFAEAVGKAQNLKLNVRAVVLLDLIGDTGKPDSFLIQVVFTSTCTSPVGCPHPGLTSPLLFPDSASSITKKVLEDQKLRSVFPDIKIADPGLFELTGPPEAILHWMAQPVLWDVALGTPGLFGPQGGPTDTFAKPADYSVSRGWASLGSKTQPWKMEQPQLGPPDDLLPGAPPPTPPSGAKTKPSSNTIWFLAAGLVVAVALFGSSKGKMR